MSDRWYGEKWNNWKGPRSPVQMERPIEDAVRGREKFTLPEPIARLAGEEYERRHQQTFKRLCERGGLGILEVIALLADRIERLEAAAGAPVGAQTADGMPEVTP